MADESGVLDVAEMVRQLLDAVGEDDFARFFAPDGLFLTGVGRFEGREAIRSYVADFASSYDELVFSTLGDVHDLGNGVVWFSAVVTGRPRGMSAQVHLRFAVVVTHVYGVVSQWTDYVTSDEARAAAERLAQERRKAVSRNTDTLRRLTDTFNAFNRGEVSSEAIAEKYDPQIEIIWRDRQTYPDVPQQLRGIHECMAMNEQYRERWIDLVQEPLEVIEAPGDRVVALIRQSGKGRQSGVPIVIHFFEVCTIRGEKVSKIEFFRHRTAALQAAGLEE